MRSGRGVRSATVTVGREAESDILAARRATARGPGSRAARCWSGRAASARAACCTRPPRPPGRPAWASRPAGPRSRRRHRSAWSPRPCGPGSRGHPLAPTGFAVRSRAPADPARMGDPPAARPRTSTAASCACWRWKARSACCATSSRPGHGLVLLLDDLHAADPDSLETIRYVASARIDGLAIVAALRPGESAAGRRAGPGAARRRRGDRRRTRAARPAGHRRTSSRHLLGAAPPGELVADVLARTDGVPLLVEEVVDAHVRARVGGARRTGRPAGAAARSSLPRSVRGMVAARLEQLPRPARDVLARPRGDRRPGSRRAARRGSAGRGRADRRRGASPRRRRGPADDQRRA